MVYILIPNRYLQGGPKEIGISEYKYSFVILHF